MGDRPIDEDDPETLPDGDPRCPHRYTLRTGQAPWFPIKGLGRGFHIVSGLKKWSTAGKHRAPVVDGHKVTIGRFWSQKNNLSLWFRSEQEHRWYMALERDPAVLRYEVEPCAITYRYQKRSLLYHPDLMVFCADGRILVVEIKHPSFVANPKDDAKFKAARQWCAFYKMEFQIWKTQPEAGRPN